MKNSAFGSESNIFQFETKKSEMGYFISEIEYNEGGQKEPCVCTDEAETGYFEESTVEIKPKLFIDFIKSARTDEAFLELANKYGFLGAPRSVTIYCGETIHKKPSLNGIPIPFELQAEPISFWHREIVELKRTHSLWNCMIGATEKYRISSCERLERIVHWTTQGPYRFGDKKQPYIIVADARIVTKYSERLKNKGYKEGFKQIYNDLKTEGYVRLAAHYEAGVRKTDSEEPLFYSDIGPDGDIEIWRLNPQHRLFNTFKPGKDTDLLIKYMVLTKINEKLHSYQPHPVLAMNEDYESCLRFIPSSLLSALWFQFSRVFAGEVVYKQCLVCNEWVDATGFYKNWSMHKECAGRLRERKRQDKENRAIKLFEEGKSVKEIAIEVDSKEATVRGWISKKRSS